MLMLPVHACMFMLLVHLLFVHSSLCMPVHAFLPVHA